MPINPLLMNTVLRGTGCVDASLDSVVQASPFAIYAITQQAYYLLHVIATARAMLQSHGSAYMTIVKLAAKAKERSSHPRLLPLQLSPRGAENLGAIQLPPPVTVDSLEMRVAVLGTGLIAESFVWLLLNESQPLVHPTRVTVVSVQRPTTNRLCKAFGTGVQWSSRAQFRAVLGACDFVVLACATMEELWEVMKVRETEVAALEPRKKDTAFLKPTTVVFSAMTGAPRMKVAQLLQMSESLIVCADKTTPQRASQIAADYRAEAETCTAQLIKQMSYALSFLTVAAKEAEELVAKTTPTSPSVGFPFQPTQWGFTMANTASMLSMLSKQAVPTKMFFAQAWTTTLVCVKSMMTAETPLRHDEHTSSPQMHPRQALPDTSASISRGQMLDVSPFMKEPHDPPPFAASTLCATLSVIVWTSQVSVAAAVLRRYQSNSHFSESDDYTSQVSLPQASTGHKGSSLGNGLFGNLPLGFQSEDEFVQNMQQHYTEVLEKHVQRLHTTG